MNVWDRVKKVFTKTSSVSRIQMVTEAGQGYYVWDGRVYKSDIVRACIRPKTQAVGKLLGKHIRQKGSTLTVNPEPYIRLLLEQPNPYMTGQMLQEKLANQLALNGNAFAVIIRDGNGYPSEIYPVPASYAEAEYDADGTLYIRFYYLNGRGNTFRYDDLIHLRRDYYDKDIFGSSQIEPLKDAMEMIGTIDKGIMQAIKNSGAIRWLLKFQSANRPEDIKKNVQLFVDNYLSIETDTFGAAGVNANVDAQQINPTDYVPNFKVWEEQKERIYAFFNTNEKIVTSAFNEEEWNSYYEAEIEPLAVQMSDVWTQRLFTRRERGVGNRITFEAKNLQCASIETKLKLVALVDRGAMTPNEWREALNMAPLPDGDQPIRRLDTQVVE